MHRTAQERRSVKAWDRPPARASDPDPWELGDELVEEEDYSQAEAW